MSLAGDAAFPRPPRDRDGLWVLAAIRDGRLPGAPAAEAIGLSLQEVGPGRVVAGFTPQPRHYNPLGVVHGGVSTTALDTAMACALISTLPAGRGLTTLELKVGFHRAVSAATGPVRAVGRVLHAGRQVGSAEAQLLDGEDRLLASATTTCLFFDLPP